MIISWTINLQYDTTVNNLNQLEIKLRLHKKHEDYKPELGYAVRIDKFAESSIDLYVCCFTQTDDWDEWLWLKKDLQFKLNKL